MVERYKSPKKAAPASRGGMTLDAAMETVARSLREFGYPKVTAKHVREIYDEYEKGKRFPDLPHDVIGGFAESQFDEVKEALRKLPR